MPSNDDNLGARRTNQSQTLAHGATDADTHSHTDKARDTGGAVGNPAQPWIAGRLPPEIWALVFGILAFRSKIAVSHVSRRWRSIALAHPAIWADVFHSDRYRNGRALTCMALSRTGKHPVRLSLLSNYDRAPGLLSCVATHMDHIKQLHWSKGFRSLPWSLPAPLLSNIHGYSLDITDDFLGGKAGSLTDVSIVELTLPATCPALSTVTNLKIEDAPDAENYDRLFILCPRLQRLSIDIGRSYLADKLPTGPAPLSLQELRLFCVDEYDLMLYYLSWKTGSNLTNVTLVQACATPAHLAALIGGAIELHVCRHYRTSRTEIAASGADGSWRRAIGFEDVDAEHAAHVASLIRPARAHMPDLRVLAIDATLLDAFMPLLAHWRTLVQLVLEVRPAKNCSWDWTGLRGLSQLRQHSESIASVVVSVAVDSKFRPPNYDDACGLLAHLARCNVRDVSIRGFSQAFVTNVLLLSDGPDQSPEGFKFGIRFESPEDGPA